MLISMAHDTYQLVVHGLSSFIELNHIVQEVFAKTKFYRFLQSCVNSQAIRNCLRVFCL